MISTFKESGASRSIRKQSLQPSLIPFRMKPDARKDHVLAIGQDFMTLVSSTGSIRCQTKLDDYSTISPIPGDWNNDGWNDIILIGTRGYYGYVMERRIGNNIFTILIGVVLTALMVAFVSNMFEDGSLSRKKKVLRSINVTTSNNKSI